jgi:phosphate transport system permease protein
MRPDPGGTLVATKLVPDQTEVTEPAEGSPDGPRSIRSVEGRGDRLFRLVARLGGIAVLAITGSVGFFLFVRATQALRSSGLKFLTTQSWQPDSHRFGIAAVLTGTVFIALTAVTISTPLAIGTALFISEVAPRRIKGLLVSTIDLMAAVPSVVFGLWGVYFLQGHIIGVARWLSTWFSWIPIFRVPGSDPTNPLATPSIFTASTFIAGVVVALMIAPIQCAIMREVFSQAPPGEREGAFALGATRWGMVRAVVLPFGRGGMIGGTMLALGRALGETVAVYLIISPLFKINFNILKSGAISVSSLIAIRYSDSSSFGLSALFAAGLALFLLTLVINFTASTVVARSRSGAISDV